MARPNIRDLAKEAGVSVSTVNRVLAGAATVRQITVEQVNNAAERIGYYGLGTIRSRIAARKPRLRFGFLLLQPNRSFYKSLGAALEAAAHAVKDHDIEAKITFAEDLAPQFVASKLLELGETCDAVGVVAVVHPLISQAIETLEQKSVPVFALISQLSATGAVNYVGLDNWKVGRTAAWAIEQICKAPGKVGILVGNHRYRCQEMNESGFRSYFREHAPAFTLLEPLSTFETRAVAEELTERMLRDHPDLVGLYVAGGGVSGAVNALRESGLSGRIVTVGHDLTDTSAAGLLDGIVTMAIAHPMQRLVSETISGMMRACKALPQIDRRTIVLPFDIHTRENV
jgi:LacI family transcriptional regulator